MISKSPGNLIISVDTLVHYLFNVPNIWQRFWILIQEISIKIYEYKFGFTNQTFKPPALVNDIMAGSSTPGLKSRYRARTEPLQSRLA
jgi:hypothetical protein